MRSTCFFYKDNAYKDNWGNFGKIIKDILRILLPQPIKNANFCNSKYMFFKFSPAAHYFFLTKQMIFLNWIFDGAVCFNFLINN